MKKNIRSIGIYFLFLLASFTSSLTSFAQTGWQWGRSDIDNYAETELDNLGVVDADGNLYVGVSVDNIYGTHTFGSITDSTPFVAKIDSAGNYLWVLSAASEPIAMSTDGANIYVLGSFPSSPLRIGSYTLTGSTTTSNVFLAKISPAGTVLWANTLANFDVFFEWNYLSMGTDPSGNTFITGAYRQKHLSLGTTTLTNVDTSGLTDDIVLAKYNTSGSLLWAKSFGGDKSDYALAMTVTSSGNCYLGGQYLSNSISFGTSSLTGAGWIDSYFLLAARGRFLSKFDENGNLIWAKNLDLHEAINALASDRNDNVYIAGFIDSNVVKGTDTFIDGPGNKSVYIAKYDFSGNYKWGISTPEIFGSSRDETAQSLSLDACGNIWVTGSMIDNMTFSGHPLTCPYYTSSEPAFLVEYDTSGNYQNSFAITSGGEWAVNVAVNNRGDFYVNGEQWSGASIVFNTDTLNTVGWNNGLFIAKYKYATSLCPAEVALSVNENTPIVSQINVYPNPATAYCVISSDLPFRDNSRVEIADMTGRVTNEQSLVGNSVTISLENNPPGIYLCKVFTGDVAVVVKKIVVVK